MFYPLFYVLFIGFALVTGGFLAYMFYHTDETKSSKTHATKESPDFNRERNW